MYQNLKTVTLRSGERVEAGIVRAPDAAWRDRIVPLLSHKGAIWNWQNAEVLTADTGMNVNFYVLHRSGDPFANAMIVDFDGVGIIGHVWTVPADRGQGAASLLMDRVMEDFAARDGKALFLDTGEGIGLTAYRIYERLGFHSVEPLSGYMAYYREPQEVFESAYFAPAIVQIQRLAWRHWAAANPLFVGDFPGLVRCASSKLVGRAITETLLLPLLYADLSRAENEKQAHVLVSDQSAAVVGFAVWDWHPIWPDTCVVDLYCHPNFRDRADDLLAALTLPPAHRLIAYADERDTHKIDWLRAHGFRQTAVLPKWIASSAAKTDYLDLYVFEK